MTMEITSDPIIMNWIETPLSKFGFKCIENKHELCINSRCKCLCHKALS